MLYFTQKTFMYDCMYVCMYDEVKASYYFLSIYVCMYVYMCMYMYT